jgi:hypothetical protein
MISVFRCFALFLFFSSSLCAQTGKPVATRTFTPIPGSDDYLVTVKITVEGIDGFAKEEELIPDGAQVTDPNAGGGCTILNNDGKLKYVWVSFPKCAEIALTYRISFKRNLATPPNKKYPGSFRYVLDNKVAVVAVE